jgi:hypothetical protein
MIPFIFYFNNLPLNKCLSTDNDNCCTGVLKNHLDFELACREGALASLFSYRENMRKEKQERNNGRIIINKMNE